MSGLLGLDYAPSDSDDTPRPVIESPANGEVTSLEHASGLVGYGVEEPSPAAPEDALHEPPVPAEQAVCQEADQQSLPMESDNANGFVPSSPSAPVDPDLQARVEKLWNNSRQGQIKFNDHLRKSKLFRNPEILEKLVEQRDLVAHGTNYSESVFNPNFTDPECFHDAIYKQQNLMLSKKAAAKEAAKAKVVTRVIGAAPVGLARQTSTGSQGGDSRKRSKWDQN
eukprot:TRINITY_DN6175_c0_g1_i1.p1 TRINITY_DN6175_c0_g1~~TRINITY_DN6175_c0_g1_i1.p1  ORF type:complete len:225 (+),score=44.03 TRINITY_DN6175_c0_g1_i1:243-917(+)